MPWLYPWVKGFGFMLWDELVLGPISSIRFSAEQLYNKHFGPFRKGLQLVSLHANLIYSCIHIHVLSSMKKKHELPPPPKRLCKFSNKRLFWEHSVSGIHWFNKNLSHDTLWLTICFWCIGTCRYVLVDGCTEIPCTHVHTCTHIFQLSQWCILSGGRTKHEHNHKNHWTMVPPRWWWF